MQFFFTNNESHRTDEIMKLRTLDSLLVTYSLHFKIKVTFGHKMRYEIKVTFSEISLKLCKPNWNVARNNVNVVV